MTSQISRRHFLKIGAGGCVAIMSPKFVGCGDEIVEPTTTTKVHAVLGDELSELYEMAKQATRQLGITGSSMTGADIFIKPNIPVMGLSWMGTNYDPMLGECAKPEIAVAVAEQCLEAGAARVTIAEGSHTISWDWSDIYFVPGTSIEGATNIKTAVDRLKTLHGDDKVQLVCLNEEDEWKRIPSSSDDPLVADGLLVARRFYEADHVISCPVMKTHQWASITVSMKNYVGLIPIVQLGNGMSRCKAHQAYAHATSYGVEEAGIAGSYVDMHKWRIDEGKEDFAIVDCSIGIEGNGPNLSPVTQGKTIDIKARNAAGKYFLLTGNDLAAMDSLVAQLMGFDIAEIKQLQMLDNLGFTSIHDVALADASFEDLAIVDMEKPIMHSEEEFYEHCS